MRERGRPPNPQAKAHIARVFDRQRSYVYSLHVSTLRDQQAVVERYRVHTAHPASDSVW